MNKNENSGGCLATLLIFVFMTPIFIGSLIGIGYGVYNIAKGSAEQKEKSQIEERIEIVEENKEEIVEENKEEIDIKREEFENEYALIIEKIKYTSLTVENIEIYKDIKNEALNLKELYSDYLEVSRLIKLEKDIVSIENAISDLELELQKIEEEKEKEKEKEKQKLNKFTLSEGHKELDTILIELSNIIVNVENKEKFNKCLVNLNYDNIVLLGSEKLNNTLIELYSIIRVPSDTTEYDKLIDRFDSFVDKCPNFYEDDRLNHKWELINNIILKPLR